MSEKEYLVPVEKLVQHRVEDTYRVPASSKEEALEKVKQNLHSDGNGVECIDSEFIDYYEYYPNEIGVPDGVLSYPDLDDIKEI